MLLEGNTTNCCKKNYNMLLNVIDFKEENENSKDRRKCLSNNNIFVDNATSKKKTFQ